MTPSVLTGHSEARLCTLEAHPGRYSHRTEAQSSCRAGGQGQGGRAAGQGAEAAAAGGARAQPGRGGGCGGGTRGRCCLAGRQGEEHAPDAAREVPTWSFRSEKVGLDDRIR